MVKKDNEQVISGRFSATGFYDQRFINQVVQEVENGLPRKAACIEYELKAVTLGSWLRKFGSPGYKAACKKQFSAAARRSVVRAVTQGRLSLKEAQAAYGINSRDTIKDWISRQKQENDELSVSINFMEDTNKHSEPSSRDLQVANEALKKQLQEAELKIAALNTLIDVAEEQLKIDIRKKPGAKQS
jgi:transposase-like protein